MLTLVIFGQPGPDAGQDESDHEYDRGRRDGLGPRDTENVAATIRDLGRDTAIVATGRDPAALALACGEVLTLADGIIVRNLASLPAPRSRRDRRLRPGKEAGFAPRDPGAAALGWTR